MIGGLGSCGRSLCCTTFLGDFEPVSIRMAKDQNLSLNPSKISGICGRLMCCLRFEYGVYEDAKETFGKACLGCGPIAVDEFYHEIEEEPDYYEDLLEEDSIQEVDYEMMVETAEIERSTAPIQQQRPEAKAPQTRRKKTSPGGEGKAPSSRRRRPRRRKSKKPRKTGDE